MPTAGRRPPPSAPAAACELGPMRDPVRDNHLGRPSTAPDMHGHRTARDQGLLVFICTAEKYCNRAASQTMPDPATIISLRRNLPRLPCQSLGGQRARSTARVPGSTVDLPGDGDGSETTPERLNNWPKDPKPGLGPARPTGAVVDRGRQRTSKATNVSRQYSSPCASVVTSSALSVRLPRCSGGDFYASRI
jgi:hypothetical protein